MDGVCNGFTNMCVQAVLQTSFGEQVFYNRLEKTSDYINIPDNPKGDVEISADKILKLKSDIQSIYKNCPASKYNLPISKEEQSLMKIHTFWESMAL